MISDEDVGNSLHVLAVTVTHISLSAQFYSLLAKEQVQWSSVSRVRFKPRTRLHCELTFKQLTADWNKWMNTRGKKLLDRFAFKRRAYSHWAES